MATIKDSIPTIMNPDFSPAISDVSYSIQGGLFKTDYDQLLNDLRNLSEATIGLSEFYKDNVLKPFIDFLITKVGKEIFNRVFCEKDLRNEYEEKCHFFIPVLAEALLQRNCQTKYFMAAFNDLLAFQIIVNTIYERAESQIQTPLPPLAVWTKRRIGAQTKRRIGAHLIIPTTFNNEANICLSLVGLPPEHRTGGLLAWSSFGHEVGGHHFLHAIPKLLPELHKKVVSALKNKFKSNTENVQYLRDYWGQIERIEELASDVLGVLNTGPSAAIGFIGYFRGVKGPLSAEGSFTAKKEASVNILNLKTSDNDCNLWIEKLGEKINISGNEGKFGMFYGQEKTIDFKKYIYHSDCHPIPALRPFAMAQVIRELKIENSEWWSNFVEEEVKNKDLQGVRTITFVQPLSSMPPQEKKEEICINMAIETARIAAKTIAYSKLQCLKKSSLIEIFSWTEEDEGKVKQLRDDLSKKDFEIKDISKLDARHIVAAATIQSLEKEADIELIFSNMKNFLVQIARFKKI